jgi:hypothetical protein
MQKKIFFYKLRNKVYEMLLDKFLIYLIIQAFLARRPFVLKRHPTLMHFAG